MGYPKVHKAPGWSQNNMKTNTGTLEQNGPTRTQRAQPNDATREQMENGPPEGA